MRQKQILLQFFDRARIDLRLGKLPESGVDPIDRLAVGKRPVDPLSKSGDLLERRRRKLQFDRFARHRIAKDVAQSGKVEMFSIECERLHRCAF